LQGLSQRHPSKRLKGIYESEIEKTQRESQLFAPETRDWMVRLGDSPHGWDHVCTPRDREREIWDENVEQRIMGCAVWVVSISEGKISFGHYPTLIYQFKNNILPLVIFPN
jgi:hypothetical protein